MTKRETAVAGLLPPALLLATLAFGFGREWLRAVPSDLAFAVPVADKLRKSGVHVYRISEASHYEGRLARRAATVWTPAGSVAALQFPDGTTGRRAAAEWPAPRPLITVDKSVLIVTTSPHLDLALLTLAAR